MEILLGEGDAPASAPAPARESKDAKDSKDSKSKTSKSGMSDKSDSKLSSHGKSHKG